MKSYVSNKGGVDSLTQREIEFLQPYLISEHAVQDYEQYTKNSSYLGETYGSYSKGKNDCYTYAVIDEPNHALGISYNPSSNVARKEMNDKEIVRLSEETGSRFYPLSSISSLHLQVGDMIGANVSPNNTGNNHWGIVAIGDSGKPVVIARGSSLEIWGLADFFGLASGVDVIRYGQSSYSQHIVFNPSNSEVQVVSGKEPKNFYE